MVQTLDRVEARPLTLKEVAAQAGIPIIIRPWWGSLRIRGWTAKDGDQFPGYWACPGRWGYYQPKPPEVQKGVVVFWEGPCRYHHPKAHQHCQTVEVVDAGEHAILVRMRVEKYTSAFLVGMDDGHPFVTQMLKRITTVEEAFYWLVPKMVLVEQVAGAEVKRQGDWFFFPYEGEVKETRTRLWPRLPTRQHIQSLRERASTDPTAATALRVALRRPETNAIYSQAPLIYGWQEPTRHIGERVIFRSLPQPLVKGTVTAPDHPTVVLDGWHVAVRRRSTPAGDGMRPGTMDD